MLKMTMYMRSYTCMHVYYVHVGSVSSGKFNSLRAKGYTRPISIFAVRSQIRSKYARMSHKAMASMLTPSKYYQCNFYDVYIIVYHCLLIRSDGEWSPCGTIT